MKKLEYNKGKLYIVSTPIGNLLDMTFRAIDTLKQVDLIAAEDTRHTKELLNHFEIDTHLTSYHEHNKYEKADEIIDRILEGKEVAIVTDAGTPIISDPGNELVKKAIDEDIEIIAIPGACAAINALVLSGLDATSFVFVGFISDDNKKRKIQIDELKSEKRTMIFYISPHKLNKDMEMLIGVFGKERLASLSREMTKKFEETKRGTLFSIKEYIETKEIRGEYVLIVAGIDKNVLISEEEKKYKSLSIAEHIKIYMDEGMSEKEALKKVARDRKVDKNEIYKIFKVRGENGK